MKKTKAKPIIHSRYQHYVEKFWPVALLVQIIIWPPLIRTCYRAVKADRETR